MNKALALLSRPLCLILFALSLVGCTYVQMPGYGNEPIAPRYYQLTLNLEIDGKPRPISVTWHCFQQWNLGTDGKLRLFTKTSLPDFVKIFDDGSAVITGPPSFSQSCEVSEGYMPSIAFMRDIKHPESIDAYPQAGATSLRVVGELAEFNIIKTIEVHEIDANSKDSSFTSEETELLAYLSSHWSEYRSRIAIVIPEKVWSGFEYVSKQFEGLSQLTFAPMNPKTAWRGAYELRVFEWNLPISPNMKSQVYAKPMKKTGSLWEIEDKLIGPSPLALRCCRGQIMPDSYYGANYIKYKDQTFNEVRLTQELYDPQDRVMVKFFEVSLWPILK